MLPDSQQRAKEKPGEGPLPTSHHGANHSGQALKAGRSMTSSRGRRCLPILTEELTSQAMEDGLMIKSEFLLSHLGQIVASRDKESACITVADSPFWCMLSQFCYG